jgi:hypothetical protein
VTVPAPVPVTRRALALVLLLLAVLTVGLTSGSGSALAAPTATGTASLQDLGACLAETKHADVLLLVDQSGSLRSTDPENTRVAAAQLFLRRLSDTAARSGSSVDVSVTGFAASVETALGWTSLDAAGLADASATVADFAAENTGFETDYWTALTGARQLLVDHRSGGSPCQALVLFTDGRYELSNRETAEQRQQYGETKPIPGVDTVPITSDEAAQQVAAAGQQDICRSGGVADQLRNDRIMLLALGLSDGGNVDLSLLSSIAESTPQQCGDTAPYGLFLAAGDVEDLVLAFDSIGDPANPPLPVDEQGVCELESCPQFAHRFTLDASIQSIHLVGTSSAAGIAVHVLPPGAAEPIVLTYDGATPAGQQTTGDLAVRYDWYADGALSVDAAIPASGRNWSGDWEVTFVDPTGQNPDAVSRTQLTIQADLGAVVDPAAQVPWRVGEDLGTVPFALVRTDGSTATLGDPAPRLGLDVVLRGEDGTETVLATGVPADQLLAGVPLQVPPEVQPGPAELRTSLAVTTVGGQVLQPQVRTTQVTVAPPLGYPTLATDSVDFGLLQGTEPGTATVAVTGPGCAWITGGALKVHPADVPEVVVTADAGGPAGCLPIGEGETAQLEVGLASPVSTAGQLQGALTVHLAPEGLPDRAVESQVAYTADLERLANSTVRVVALVGALLIGVLLPVLVFLLGRRIAARLPDQALQSLVVPVRIGPGGLLDAGGGPLSLPTRWDLVPSPVGGRRRTTLSGIPVRARAGVKLTDAGHAEVTDTALAGVAGAPGGRSPRSGQARLPLSLQGSWSVLLDRASAGSSASDLPARLLLVSDAGATEAQRAEVLARARAEAPSAVAALREQLDGGRADGTPDAPGSVDPFADPSAGTTARQDPFDSAAGRPSGGGTRRADPFGNPTGGSSGTDPSGRTGPSPTTPHDDPFR